jgi:hypothetical protein
VPYVVTGISPDGNTAALEAALKAAGLSLEALVVLGPDDAEIATGGLIDTAIITGSGLESGTGVPGLTGSGTGLLAGNSLWDRLADLAIPDDEVENYAEALEAGRSIVGYHGDSRNVSKVEAMFAGAGLTKIKTF